MGTTVSFRPSRLLLSCLSYFTFSIYVHHACALSFNLSFSDTQRPNNLDTLIHCTGEAYFDANTLQVSRNRRDQSSTYSTGRAQYTQTMRLWDRTTSEMASFTTTFSFQITPDPSTNRFGDGINDAAYNVSTAVDLRSYLPEDVLVGFSASTGKAGEQHQILSWSFSSTLEPTTPPPQVRRKVGTTLIAILVPLLVLLACAAVGLLLWRRHKKRQSSETSDDSDDHEQDYRAELERGVVASGPR
ncbi:hypothetical protein EJB05_42138, partial [Eragrostis curvula]